MQINNVINKNQNLHTLAIVSASGSVVLSVLFSSWLSVSFFWFVTRRPLNKFG